MFCSTQVRFPKYNLQVFVSDRTNFLAVCAVSYSGLNTEHPTVLRYLLRSLPFLPAMCAVATAVTTVCNLLRFCSWIWLESSAPKFYFSNYMSFFSSWYVIPSLKFQRLRTTILTEKSAMFYILMLVECTEFVAYVITVSMLLCSFHIVFWNMFCVPAVRAAACTQL